MNAEALAAQPASVAVTTPSQREILNVHAMPKRRLATILSADVVGYSRLMQQDDRGTVETLKQNRSRIGEISVIHQGRVVNTPGDSILVEFSSAVEAFAAAIEMQDSVESCNQEVDPRQRMHFRIGMDLGDILVDSDGSVYGNGVNIAARMEALARQGGIVMSGKVFDEMPNSLKDRFHALGRRRVKNIRDRVRAYEVMPRAATDRSIQAAPRLATIARGLLMAAMNYLVPSLGALDANHALSSPVE